MLKELIVLSCVVLASCSSEPTKEQKKAVYEATVQQVNCGRAHVAEVDDGISDGQSIAWSLSMRCNAESEIVLTKMCEEYNDNVCEKLGERMRSRDTRIQSFIEIVMEYRHHPKK